MEFNYALRMKYEQQCPDCGASDFVEDHAQGDLICRACGVVVEAHVIDERSEWRTFADADKGGGDPSRVGAAVNPLLSDGGMSTIIGGGRGVDQGMLRNLQRMQARTEITSDRALIGAFKEIGKICGAMKLLDIVKKQAEEVYKEAHDRSRSIKGKSQAAVLAAVVFIACRQTGNARSFKEICKVVANASVKDIGRVYKSIVADLGLGEAMQEHASKGAHPSALLPRHMSNLGMTRKEGNWGVALANVLLPQEGPAADQHTGWHGKQPTTIAAAIIYIVGSLPGCTQVELGSICREVSVAEQTIQQVYREIHPHLASLIQRAGGFATPQQIAKLPPPRLQQLQQP